MTRVLLHTITGERDVDARPAPQLVVAIDRRANGEYILVKKNPEEDRSHKLVLPGGSTMNCGVHRREKLRELYLDRTRQEAVIGDYLATFLITGEQGRTIFVYRAEIKPVLSQWARTQLLGTSDHYQVVRCTAAEIMRRRNVAASVKTIVSWYEDYLAKCTMPKISIIKNP